VQQFEVFQTGLNFVAQQSGYLLTVEGHNKFQ